MSLKTISIAPDATVSATGGVAETIVSLGNTMDRLTLAFADDSFINQRQIECSVVRPKANNNTPNGYTQARRRMFVRIPRTLANGNVTVDKIVLEIDTDHEITDAQILEYRKIAAQLAISSAADEFFNDLSIG